MTISDEAKRAAAHLYDDGWPDTTTCASVIQQAINVHERDLVDALKALIAAIVVETPYGVIDQKVESARAALKKRGIE